MALVSRLFQASFSATLLRSTALAIALIVQASPARAEPVTLSCRHDEGSETLTLRINYATGLVEQLAPSGKTYTDRVATATISPNAIVWRSSTAGWVGGIDRLSGTGWMQWSNEHGWPVPLINFTCREAKKPKF